jgi:hypothetical protein
MRLSMVTAASKPSSVRVGPNHKRLSMRLQRTPTSFTVPYKRTIQMLLLITFHNHIAKNFGHKKKEQRKNLVTLHNVGSRF